MTSLSCTEQALNELMQQLDDHPELYKSVLKKRRREQKEEEGFMAYVKVPSPLSLVCVLSLVLQVKLWSLVGVEEASCSVSDLECQEEMMKLKANMMKAHTYSQGMPSSLQSVSDL